MEVLRWRGIRNPKKGNLGQGIALPLSPLLVAGGWHTELGRSFWWAPSIQVGPDSPDESRGDATKWLPPSGPLLWKRAPFQHFEGNVWMWQDVRRNGEKTRKDSERRQGMPSSGYLFPGILYRVFAQISQSPCFFQLGLLYLGIWLPGQSPWRRNCCAQPVPPKWKGN